MDNCYIKKLPYLYCLLELTCQPLNRANSVLIILLFIIPIGINYYIIKVMSNNEMLIVQEYERAPSSQFGGKTVDLYRNYFRCFINETSSEL